MFTHILTFVCYRQPPKMNARTDGQTDIHPSTWMWNFLWFSVWYLFCGYNYAVLDEFCNKLPASNNQQSAINHQRTPLACDPLETPLRVMAELSLKWLQLFGTITRIRRWSVSKTAGGCVLCGGITAVSERCLLKYFLGKWMLKVSLYVTVKIMIIKLFV